MASDLQLVVRGTAYGGWQRMRVRRSLEEIAGQFELRVTDRWPEQNMPRTILTGDRAAVVIDGQTVITGYVDSTTPSLDARAHSITIAGRDATGDLVDCAARHKLGEWRGANLAQIARDLAAPYAIPVHTRTEVGAAFPSWAIQEGESAFECLERAARQRGVLLLSDGIGGLVLGRAGEGAIGTALVEGENLLRGEVRNDASQRYASYILKGQQTGDDEVFGEAASALKATATDAGVTRPRVLLLVSEDEGDQAALQRRAQWEANVRAARALTATVTVQGWRHAHGLWAPNRTVQLRTPTLGLDRDLLIRDVELICDEQGLRSELTLTPIEAYSLMAMPGKKKPRKSEQDDSL
ncbi:phage baseplate assembly protein [Pseudoxanthomonas sp. UTMC 1351]|uniref:phage baseplate assembly protein n=1 Tax=Pseudoxanthomonas sp. UTMC 1351 TaxID=2695853 RepID=UPI0034CDE231